MKRICTGVMMAAIAATQVMADETLVVQQISQCIVDTGSQGAYKVTEFDKVPVVVADAGGTERGARNVNDCLQDNYNVQYDNGAFGVADGNKVASGPDVCQQERIQGFVIGTVVIGAINASLGGNFFAGAALGNALTWGTIQRDYRECVRREGGAKYAGVEFHSGCSRHSDVLHGGAQYCR
ncbi:hypothetical protein [Shimia sp. R9_3]|uniref:hypothetical protein n=1 Tax=Shimia sp. R9_3 TaxID=2821113 RepID=UPI001ADCD148|nr:hypothetical protein [Shimia sp. R9_3]MBO9400325.1 hypothetical protein [Shimia sp. R9_3]